MTDTYALTHDGGLVPTAPTDPTTAATSASVPRWVRLSGDGLTDWEAWLDVLQLPREMRDDLPSGGRRARVVSHGAVLLVTLPVLCAVGGEAPVLQLACGPGLLVTTEPARLPAIDRIVAEFCGHHRLVEASLPAVLLDIIDTAVRSDAPAYLALRRSLDDLDEALEDHPLDVPSDALLDVKRRLGRLSMLWEEQGYCVIELQRRRAHVPKSEGGREQFRVLVSDLDRGLKLLAQMEGRLRDLRQHHLHSLQEVANRRLNVLAVLSAIYLPATLIAGIYGMNFENIPATRVPYGYVLVMMGMAAIVVGQLVYFYRRGWFA